MKNKKAEFGKIAGLIPVLLIMVLGLIIMSKVGGEELGIVSKLWGGERGGPVIGSRYSVEIEPGKGYDFETGFAKEMNVMWRQEESHHPDGTPIYKTIRLSGLQHSDISSPDGDDLEAKVESTLIAVTAELKKELEETEKLVDVDCINIPPDATQYEDIIGVKNNVGAVSSSDVLCVKTDKGHIVKVKVRTSGEMVDWEDYIFQHPEDEIQMIEHGDKEVDPPEKGPVIEWWYQRLNYEPGDTEIQSGKEYTSFESGFSFQTEVLYMDTFCQICSGYLSKAECEDCYQAKGHMRLDAYGEPRDDDCYCDDGTSIDPRRETCNDESKRGIPCTDDGECATAEKCIDTGFSALSSYWSDQFGLTGSWMGIDFDNSEKQSGWDYYENYDMWYSPEHGILFDSGLRRLADKEGEYPKYFSDTFQRGRYIGSKAQADNIFCDELTPMLYSPKNNELGYLPPVDSDSYYCIITSENRAVKLHWYSEEGEEDPKFEWWYES